MTSESVSMFQRLPGPSVCSGAPSPSGSASSHDAEALEPNPVSETTNSYFAEAYQDLRRVARSLRRRSRDRLSTQSLVHETYLRMIRQRGPTAATSADHLQAVAITAMRQVVIDRRRRTQALKRGAGLPTATVRDPTPATERNHPFETRYQLAEAVRRLSQTDQRLARVVVLRWVRGLTPAQTAAQLRLSERSVRRACLEARRELRKRLSRPIS